MLVRPTFPLGIRAPKFSAIFVSENGQVLTTVVGASAIG
jgi:hypothetical protein